MGVGSGGWLYELVDLRSGRRRSYWRGANSDEGVFYYTEANGKLQAVGLSDTWRDRVCMTAAMWCWSRSLKPTSPPEIYGLPAGRKRQQASPRGGGGVWCSVATGTS